ncbi:hypothetical protein MKW98_025950 [Papaver atlanticum]|uniref:ABC transporter domain-containing protein n=1 Tax=Papaver atlanticum TaxID=357466 RepID=A0AAD4XFZ0_9MAGN|nr:hypothetical protein MKW98_025950 [Papaver atlanticum]
MAEREEHIYPVQFSEQEASIKKVNSHPVMLKFNNVTYKINTKKIGSWVGERTCSKSKLDDDSNEKVILKGITGTVQPGEMLAILGPSGCGKTYLLTALGGRLLGGKLSGTITYNGKPYLSNAMNRNIGYVAQDDRFYAHLTVTETLMFTALLQLPNTITKEEKIIRTEEVIKQLGLTGCKNSIMGGPFIRGVSGGERKRVCIGLEILTNPSLLLLDEPTSGLDSTSAQQVVSMLSVLASESHQTVLVSIHQPSRKLIYMFHKILLFSDGNPLYFGRGNETIEYFSSIGYFSPVAVNLCDFLVDPANGVYLGDLDDERRKDIKQGLVLDYKSNLLNRMKKEEKLEVDNNNGSGRHDRMDKNICQWPTTWGQQFSVLLKGVLLERKHESFSIMQVGQLLVVSFLSGILWWNSSINHLDDQIGFIFTAIMHWSLYPMFTTILTFPQERIMLIKEQSSRMYRLSSYFIARNVADLPMELALPIIFVIITYWMVGLKPTVGSFSVTLFVILYNVLVSQGLGLVIGSAIMNPTIGSAFGGIISQAFLLASGFYIKNVPSFVAWIKYFSHNYYVYKLLLGSQYKNDDLYQCGPNVSYRVGSNPTIKQFGLGNEVISVVALGLMLVGYRVIAYIFLKRLRETK